MYGSTMLVTLTFYTLFTYMDLFLASHVCYFRYCLDLRLKFMTTFMLIVLGVSITVMVLRFGVNALHDSFVSESSLPFANAVQFLTFYGLLNYYIFTMAFVYSPSQNAASGECAYNSNIINVIKELFNLIFIISLKKSFILIITVNNFI